MKPGARYELWYADASEVGLWPHLARGGRRRGRQRAVRTPGRNQKLTVFGAFCCGRGLFRWCTQPSRRAAGMRELVRKLLRRARRTGRKIVLVLDQGSPNHARSLHRDLDAARPWIEVFWLPHYGRELNLIERLWKHLKASRLANVLFAGLGELARHVHRALEDFAKHPDLILSIVNPSPGPPKRKNLPGHT